MKSNVSVGQLKAQQEQLAKQLRIEDSVSLDEIKYIAGFDVSYVGNKCICAAAVLNFKTMEVVERKVIVARTPMNYVPGLLAFREGPAICQAYYDLEYEPDVLIVDGHGIAHELNAGLATFVGVELGKPVIGVAKNLLVGEAKDDSVFLDGELVGKLVKTKEHANALVVSPGNFLSVETSAEIIRRCVVPPHKLPEPLHVAHRFADKAAQRQKEEVIVNG